MTQWQEPIPPETAGRPILSLSDACSAAQSKGPFAVSLAVMDALAGRFRSEGLFLIALDPDDSIAWHDAGAGAFFLRYVLPQVKTAAADQTSADAAQSPSKTVAVNRNVPGVFVAAVPYIEKRQKLGTLLVAGREESFNTGDDFLSACKRLELDPEALQLLAQELPVHTPSSLQRQSQIVYACLRDQGRMQVMECELNSISEQLAATYEELTLIYQVSGGMKVNRSAADFFKQIGQDVLAVTGTLGVGVALTSDCHPKTDPVMYGQVRFGPAVTQRLSEELFSYFRERKTPLVLNDLASQTRFPWLCEHARQLLAVPLQRHERIYGCLFVLDKEAGDFDSTDAKLLISIANESAIFLENAQLFDDVHGLMMGLLHSLTSAVDAKDAYTCGHSERVALLSRHLAQQLGVSDRQIEQIYMAGLLHDVGKIGVPEHVLQKTGRLTPEEFELMKKHPEIGAKILQDVRQVKELIPGVLHHHERFDGKGYPTGLYGLSIPLMGRIICLSDSFDAMTSNRTYRQALPLEVALAEIHRCSGTHFDPELAEIFLHTSADHYREILQDHQQKSKRLLHLHEDSRINGSAIVTAA